MIFRNLTGSIPKVHWKHTGSKACTKKITKKRQWQPNRTPKQFLLSKFQLQVQH